MLMAQILESGLTLVLEAPGLSLVFVMLINVKNKVSSGFSPGLKLVRFREYGVYTLVIRL